MKVFEIGLSCGKTITVDEADAVAVMQHRWHFTPNYRGGYAATTVDYKKVYLHRFIAKARPGEIVDHINRDKLDNRRSNLRIATSSQNGANQISVIKPASGYRGVAPHRKGFRSQIYVNRKRIRGRTRKSTAAAAHDYDAMARLHFGEFAILNFPEDRT